MGIIPEIMEADLYVPGATFSALGAIFRNVKVGHFIFHDASPFSARYLHEAAMVIRQT